MAKLSSKRNAKKELSAEEQEQALKKLKSKKKGTGKNSTRVTIDFPTEVHEELKQMVKEQGYTLKGYIVGLVRKDLKNY